LNSSTGTLVTVAFSTVPDGGFHCESMSSQAKPAHIPHNMLREIKLRIVEQAAGHLRWKVDYPPSQPVGSGFEPHWRPQPAKLPSLGGYSLETLPSLHVIACIHTLGPQKASAYTMVVGKPWPAVSGREHGNAS